VQAAAYAIAGMDAAFVDKHAARMSGKCLHSSIFRLLKPPYVPHRSVSVEPLKVDECWGLPFAHFSAPPEPLLLLNHPKYPTKIVNIELKSGRVHAPDERRV
jgi:hypothetical protein